MCSSVKMSTAKPCCWTSSKTTCYIKEFRILEEISGTESKILQTHFKMGFLSVLFTFCLLICLKQILRCWRSWKIWLNVNIFNLSRQHDYSCRNDYALSLNVTINNLGNLQQNKNQTQNKSTKKLLKGGSDVQNLRSNKYPASKLFREKSKDSLKFLDSLKPHLSKLNRLEDQEITGHIGQCVGQ